MMLILDETQIDAFKNQQLDSLKNKYLVNEIIKTDFNKEILVRTIDTPKPEYLKRIKPDKTFKFSFVNYKSIYFFSTGYIIFPLDLNVKIQLKYSNSEKIGYIDYLDIKNCK